MNNHVNEVELWPGIGFWLGGTLRFKIFWKQFRFQDLTNKDRYGPVPSNRTKSSYRLQAILVCTFRIISKSLNMIGSNPIGPNLIHSAQVVILSQSSPDSYLSLIK